MTIKNLKNNILLALYERYKNGSSSMIELDKLCISNSIIYDSEKQLFDAIESLKSQNLVKAILFMNNKGMIGDLTPKGIQYVEENLLTDDDSIVDGLKATEKLMKSGALVDVDIDSEPEGNTDLKANNYESIAYDAKENYLGIMDSSVAPCFGVTALADCYIKQLDKIAEHTNDNFCMLGIFGPWGRGKTYFFQQIKKLLDKRVKENATELKYKIIEFNAWKYQDTPAIWAYLYETIYKECFNYSQRFLFYIKQLWFKQWLRIISVIAIYVIMWILYWQISELPELSERIKVIMQSLNLPLACFTALSGLLYSIIKNPISIHETIEKHFKRKSYKGILGIQNDLEQNLELLIKSISKEPKKEQIVLYVDDIDRCETSKMLNVVNSLRLILENTEIQNRMIVICSIDANKLIEAYCKNKFAVNNYTEEQLKEAKQHLDKLFVFSVGLPSIDQKQQIEYLEKLYTSGKEQANVQPPFSINREKHSIIVTKGDKKLTELTSSELGKLLSKYLQDNKIEELTPRKIRIIFYRLQFANNIIAAGSGTITEEILKQIIALSLDSTITNTDIDTAYSDVIGTVVPY